MRRWKLSAKKRASAFAGWAMASSECVIHGMMAMLSTASSGGAIEKADPGGGDEAFAVEIDAIAGGHDDGEAGQHDQRRHALERPEPVGCRARWRSRPTPAASAKV